MPVLPPPPGFECAVFCLAPGNAPPSTIQERLLLLDAQEVDPSLPIVWYGAIEAGDPLVDLLGGFRATRIFMSSIHKFCSRFSFALSGVCLLAAQLLPNGLGHAQEAVSISSRPVCSTCTIELAPVAVLGSRMGPGQLGWEPSSVRRTSDGRYLVSQFVHGTEILVFGANGRHLRTIGREGEGPGEFKYIARVEIDRFDSIYVFDNGNARISVFDPDLSLARSSRLPGSFTYGAVVLPTGSMVTNGTFVTADAVGLPLHLLRDDGEWVESFGSETGAVRPGLRTAIQRIVAPEHAGNIWAVHRTQYVIELWNVDGALQRTLIREVDWFPPYLERPIGGDEPPPPIVMAVNEIAPGKLMVLVNVPAPDYLERRGPPVRISARGNPIHDLSRKQELNDTVIEIIDAVSGRLLLSRRVDDYLTGFASGEHVYGYRVDDLGFPFIDIMRVRFTQY